MLYHSDLQMNFPDILIVNANDKGQDFLIGDLHGEKDALQSIISKLGKHDRLFIAGDLADRGADSLGVFSAIIEANAGLAEPKIYVVRGNHEDVFMQYYHARKLYESKGDEPSKTSFEHIKQWLSLLGGDWVFSLKESDLELVANFISKLPYVIHTKNGNEVEAFNMVHADLPFSNEELQQRMKAQKLSLSAEEKSYATWAREQDRDVPITVKSDSLNTITYCGHSIGGGVRLNSNHVNLDFGTFCSYCVCVLSHSKAKCVLLVDKPEAKSFDFGNGKTPMSVKKDIDAYYAIRKKMDACVNYLDSLNLIIKSVVNRHKLGSSDISTHTLLQESKKSGSSVFQFSEKNPWFSERLQQCEMLEGMLAIFRQNGKALSEILKEADVALISKQEILMKNLMYASHHFFKAFGKLGDEIFYRKLDQIHEVGLFDTSDIKDKKDSKTTPQDPERRDQKKLT